MPFTDPSKVIVGPPLELTDGKRTLIVETGSEAEALARAKGFAPATKAAAAVAAAADDNGDDEATEDVPPRRGRPPGRRG